MNSLDKNPFILSNSNTAHKKLIKRSRAELRFKLYGLISVSVSVAFLMFLLITIISNGTSAFERTAIKVNLDVPSELKEQSLELTAENLADLNYRKIVSDGLKKMLPETTDREQMLQMNSILSRSAFIEAKKSAINKFEKEGTVDNITLWLTASSIIDMYIKGKVDINVTEDKRNITDYQIQLAETLKFHDSIKRFFNFNFLKNSDSREPEQAGIYGGLLGSFFVIFVCMLTALPVGVGAAIYLQEFAPKRRFVTMLEIGINNLAAIPSIVYGLVGLAIFINIFGLPRSSAMVGGLTLALLVLPVIIVSTRNSIAAVPPSIKDAAIALGASKMQVVFHHVLPLSLPGIMTGAILSMARALGETAPLLLIGMVAFVRDIPEKVTDPASALPVQIFLWSDLPELGFVEKTSAAIMILLLFLILANALAVYLRRKFEYKW